MNCTHDVSRKNVGEHRALIVGGSGGIGAALSRALVSKGADVTNLSRSSDGFDISDPDKVKLHMDHLSGTFQTVIVASGILASVGKRPEKSLNEIDADHMMRVLAVNAIGPAPMERTRYRPSHRNLKAWAVFTDGPELTLAVSGQLLCSFTKPAIHPVLQHL
ncbi:NAD-dependent epimerase/dehydratase family protein [Pseudophaeobacter sp. EL27]|uniref:NAD-dependent epimerase/dehydratase family protein n=1 Tax=Pseudophaeobacter sp. EL27 TaxID=2107580 RepID=UPI000EFDA8CF|nr:NAD-dependent epimerase/dehydratase family protein [Pseudophaeobacter sp. EL27]